MHGYKLARVRWSLGQTLLPEHLSAQEDALSAEIRLSARLQGLPWWGVARLRWSEELLLQGGLSISSLTAAFAGGELIDVPGNAFLSPFDLNAAGKARVTVHLHLMEETQAMQDNPLYLNDPIVVERVLHRLRLSADPVLDGARGTLKLAELEKDSRGAWRVSRRYVPPLLLAGTSPFLRTLLSELEPLLESFHLQLLHRLEPSNPKEQEASAAWRCLTAVLQVQALLSDLRNEVYPHPYALFRALRKLYFEVCCFSRVRPAEELPRYLHEDLATTFSELLNPLHKLLAPAPDAPKCQRFERLDRLFVLSPLPPDVKSAGEVYLVARRSDRQKPGPFDDVKLASIGRLPIVYRERLRGVPFQYVEAPTFSHSFGDGADFYMLTTRQDEEWSNALQENALAFQILPHLEQVQVSLFCR